MSNPGNETAVERRRQFVSNAFHTLNQPLTGLHCGLEITLAKPRRTEEYWKRAVDSLSQASEIMALIRAIRELADSADPGERFGTVSVCSLLAQLKNDLEVLSETQQGTVAIECPTELRLLADPAKFMRCVGVLLTNRIERLEPGWKLSIAVQRAADTVGIDIKSEGQLRPRDSEQPPTLEEKVSEIHRDAALSYIWTLGGEVITKGPTTRIVLPRSESNG
jgi:signal transduction histidine kinase